MIVHWLTAVVACLLPLAGEIDARRTRAARARTNQGKTK